MGGERMRADLEVALELAQRSRYHNAVTIIVPAAIRRVDLTGPSLLSLSPLDVDGPTGVRLNAVFVATFSENGPEKCSGIPVHRYSETEMVAQLQKVCERIKCFTVDHVTPFDTVQNFLFCAFRKKP